MKTKGMKILSQSVVRERGATLVEVMVAGAVATVLGLGITQMMVNMNKGAVSVQRKDDFTELQRVLTMFGGSTAQCGTMLGAPVTSNTTIDPRTANTYTYASGTGVNIPKANGTAGSTSITVDGKYGSGILIKSISLSWPGTAVGGGSYVAYLNISAERYDTSKPNARVPGPPLTGSIPITLVDSDSNNRVDTCVMGQNSDEPRSEVVVAQLAPADHIGTTCAKIVDALVDADANNPARTVFIKSGTYTGCSNIVLPKNVTIRGEPGTILSTAADSPVFTVSSASNSINTTIKDLTISRTGGAFWGGTGILIQTSNVTIENVRFINTAAKARAINIKSSGTALSNIVIRNNYFSWNGSMLEAVAYPSVSNVQFIDNLAPAISDVMLTLGDDSNATTFSNWIVSGNAVTTSAGSTLYFGILNTSSSLKRMTFSNNTLRATGGGNILGFWSDVNTINSEISVIGNTLTSSATVSSGIRIGPKFNSSGLRGFLISNNSIHLDTAVTDVNSHGIVNEGANGALISNNSISNFYKGISVDGGTSGGAGTAYGDHTHITGNKIYNCKYGIHFDRSYIVITDNHIDEVDQGIATPTARAGTEIFDYFKISDNYIGPKHAVFMSTYPVTEDCPGVTANLGVGICMFARSGSITDNFFEVQSAGFGVETYGIVLHNGTTGSVDVMGNDFSLWVGQAVSLVQPHATNKPVASYSNDQGDYNFRGGVNVGTGAPVNGKLSVNGEKVPQLCERVSNSSSLSNVSRTDVTATCPAGKFAIACTGYVNSSPIGAAQIYALYSPNNNTCFIRGQSTSGGVITGIAAGVYAMCCDMEAPF